MIYVLAAFAVYRLAHMLTLERGPFDTAYWLRTVIYRRWPDDADGQPSWQFAGVTCPLCISFWLGWLAALALPYTDWREYTLTALGLSGVVVAVHKWTSK